MCLGAVSCPPGTTMVGVNENEYHMGCCPSGNGWIFVWTLPHNASNPGVCVNPQGSGVPVPVAPMTCAPGWTGVPLPNGAPGQLEVCEYPPSCPANTVLLNNGRCGCSTGYELQPNHTCVQLPGTTPTTHTQTCPRTRRCPRGQGLASDCTCCAASQLTSTGNCCPTNQIPQARGGCRFVSLRQNPDLTITLVRPRFIPPRIVVRHPPGRSRFGHPPTRNNPRFYRLPAPLNST